MKPDRVKPHRGLIAGTVSLFLLLTSCGDTSSSRPLDDFRWMTGSWTSQRSNGRMVEQWKEGTDSTMSGAAALVQPDGTSKPFEQILLVFRNGEFYYVVTSAEDSASTPVSFRLTSYSDSGFVAENQSHDFPKRIMYRYIAPDSLLAIIDAGPARPEEKVDFRFSREKP